MSDSKGFFHEASYLGQHKNISRGILKKTACMGVEERETIALLEAVKKVFPVLENEDIASFPVPELIDKIVMPFIENKGFATWQRDVVTDMAMRKGDTSLKEQWKAHRKLNTEQAGEEQQ